MLSAPSGEVKRLLNEVRRRIPVEVVPKRYEVRDARDLVVAYVEVLNAGLRLLPLYNHFTFFLYSLRLTPKPYLRLMYGERLFDGAVTALMEKYGVKIGLRIAPGLGKELDEELGFIGHLEDTVGDLVVQIIARLYEVFGGQEFKAFVDRYREHAAHFCEDAYLWEAEIVGGVVRMHKIDGDYKKIESVSLAYHEFLERAAPLAFLGLLVPTRSNSLWICCKPLYIFNSYQPGCTSYTVYEYRCLAGIVETRQRRCWRMASIEVKGGASPEEFLYVVRVLRRREPAPSGKPHAAHIDASRQTVEARLRLVKPVFETPRLLSYPLDLSLPQIAKIDLRLRPLSPSFEEPRQIPLQLEYGVPPVKPLAASLKPITISFKEVPQIRLNLSFEPPPIAPLQLRPAGVAPSFERPREVSVSVDFSAPSLATASPQPGLPDAPEAPLEELEEVYSEPLLRLGVVISERPVVIVARSTDFGYIEFLKRVLREIYRVRSGGLPEPKHVSTPEDFRLLLPVDVGAGKRLFVLDLSGGLKVEKRDLERLRDRLRELFSQEFGFFVIYGDVLSIWERALAEAVRGYASVVPSPAEVSIRPGRLPLYVLLANAMWGRVSDPVLDYGRLGFRDRRDKERYFLLLGAIIGLSKLHNVFPHCEHLTGSLGLSANS